MEVQGRAQRERLVAGVTDEAVELTDAAPQVGLTPHLKGRTDGRVRAQAEPWDGEEPVRRDAPERCEQTSCRRSR